MSGQPNPSSEPGPPAVAVEQPTNAGNLVKGIGNKWYRYEQVKKSSPVWHFIYALVDGPLPSGKTTTRFFCLHCTRRGLMLENTLICLSADGNPSNGKSHASNAHKTEWNALLEQRAASGVVESKGCRGSDPTERRLTSLDKMTNSANCEVLQQVYVRLVGVMAHHVLPLTFVTAPDVTELLQFASTLRPKSYVGLTRARRDEIISSLFAEYLALVKHLVGKARKQLVHPNCSSFTEAHADVLHESESLKGWITVCHDGWDAAHLQFFGVTIMFILPLPHWKLYKIPIGLFPPESHSSDDCATAAELVLARVGITLDDVLSSVNDTTNSAVKTGRLLAGTDGDCKMHVSSLMVEHAIGKRTRKQNGEIVDSFPVHERLRVKHRAVVVYLFGGKSKGRYYAYQDRCNRLGKGTIRVSLDNDTRVAGTQRLFQFQLRSMYCQEIYFGTQSEEVRKKKITAAEWELTAQFEAVTRDVVQLNFSSQVDNRVNICHSWLFVCRGNAKINKQTYDVVDLSQQDSTLGWGANRLFQNLPKKKMKVEDLTAEARELRRRIQDEFEDYLGDPDDDQLRALWLCPVMMTVGMSFLDIVDAKWQEHRDTGRKLLLQDVKDFLSQNSVLVDEEPNEGQVDMECSQESIQIECVDDFFSSVVASAPMVETAVTNDITEQAEIAVKEWERLEVSWKAYLSTHNPPKTGLKVNLIDPYYLIEVVDTLEWWKENQPRFPDIARVAAIRLAKPDANGMQERVFSFSKRLDTPLRRRLRPEKFEMLALLGFNMDLLAEEGENAVGDFMSSSILLENFNYIVDTMELVCRVGALAENRHWLLIFKVTEY
jgi:hAT family C-terminal dimerisation region